MRVLYRGQAEILAVVLLIGFVLISAMAVFVVGSSTLSGVETQSQSEYDDAEFKSVSNGIYNTIHSSEGRSIADIQDEYKVNDGANVRVYINGTEHLSYNTGQITRNDYVYEGGMVIRDNYTIGSPDVFLRDDSTLLSIPKINGNEFSGNVQYNDLNRVSVSEDDYVDIYIQSEYYEFWHAELNEMTATKYDGNNTVHISIREPNDVESINQTVSHSIMMGGEEEIQLGSFSNFTLSNQETTIGSPNSIHFAAGGGGVGNTGYNIPGKVVSGEEIKPETNSAIFKKNNFGDLKENEDVPQPVSTAHFMPDEPEEWEELDEWEVSTGKYEPTATDVTLSDGQYYVPGDLTVNSVNFHLENVSLYVSGDLDIKTPNTNANGPLELYVEDNVNLGNTNINGDVKDISLFTTGDQIKYEQGSFHGLIHGTNANFYVVDGFNGHGVLVVGGMSSDSGTLNFVYKEISEDGTIRSDSSTKDHVSVGENESYVDIRVPEVAVD